MGLPSRPHRSLPELSAVGLLLLLPSGTLAVTLRVPAEFPTIRAAALAAVEGDTILVAPGTYDQGGDLLPIRSGVSLVSEEGYEVTHLLDFGFAHFNDDTPGAGVSRLIGFSIDGGACSFDHPTVVEGNYVRGRDSGYSWSWVHASCEFRRNTFTGAADGYFLMGTTAGESATWRFEENLFLTGDAAPFGEVAGWGTNHLVLRNNTCAGFHGLLVYGESQHTEIEIVNNAFYGTGENWPVILDCPARYNVTYDVRYNAFWRAYVTCPLGEGNFTADPLFCDPGGGDYRLHASSPLIGAGEGGVTIGAFGVGCGVTAAGDTPPAARAAWLSVFPNPVRHTAAFTIDPPVSGWTLEIYDAQGRLLDALQPVGSELRWTTPESATSGVYFARLQGAQTTQVVKFLVLR